MPARWSLALCPRGPDASPDSPARRRRKPPPRGEAGPACKRRLRQIRSCPGRGVPLTERNGGGLLHDGFRSRPNSPCPALISGSAFRRSLRLGQARAERRRRDGYFSLAETSKAIPPAMADAALSPRRRGGRGATSRLTALPCPQEVIRPRQAAKAARRTSRPPGQNHRRSGRGRLPAPARGPFCIHRSFRKRPPKPFSGALNCGSRSLTDIPHAAWPEDRMIRRPALSAQESDGPRGRGGRPRPTGKESLTSLRKQARPIRLSGHAAHVQRIQARRAASGFSRRRPGPAGAAAFTGPASHAGLPPRAWREPHNRESRQNPHDPLSRRAPRSRNSQFWGGAPAPNPLSLTLPHVFLTGRGATTSKKLLFAYESEMMPRLPP